MRAGEVRKKGRGEAACRYSVKHKEKGWNREFCIQQDDYSYSELKLKMENIL